MVPLRERGKYQGYANIAYGVSVQDRLLLSLVLTHHNSLDQLLVHHWEDLLLTQWDGGIAFTSTCLYY